MSEITAILRFLFITLQVMHKMSIRSDIRFRFATTEIECIIENDKDTAQEILFDVTLPKEAFISNFSM